MLIDDDRSGLESLGQALKLHGYRPKKFTDPETALASYRTEPTDIVVSDFQLPGMDGIQILKALKNIQPEVRVILITAAKNDQIVIEALNLGARAFFLKPIHFEELIRTLTTLTEEIYLQRKRVSELRDLKERYRLVSEEISHLGKIIAKIR